MKNRLLSLYLVAPLLLASPMAGAEDCWKNDCSADAGSADAPDPGYCEPGEGCFGDAARCDSQCMLQCGDGADASTPT